MEVRLRNIPPRVQAFEHLVPFGLLGGRFGEGGASGCGGL